MSDRYMSFQDRVTEWLYACIGDPHATDKYERSARFLEESLELVQSGGMSRDDAHRLVDYVFDRPVGDCGQEIGGVMLTLAALCHAHSRNLNSCAEMELSRAWLNIDRIRKKHAAKPLNSPLPQETPGA